VVIPAEYEGKKVLAELPSAGRCEPVFIHYGLRQLKIALRPAVDQSGETINGSERVLETLSAELQKAMENKQAGSVFKLVKAEDLPDFVVECAKKGVELIDASGLAKSVAVDPKSPKTLIDHLETIFRARNLLSVAGRLQEQQNGQRNAVEIQVELIRYRNGREEILKSDGDRSFRAGDRAAFRITNRSPSKILNVALLIVRSSGEIVAYFPASDEVCKAMKPQESFTTTISEEFTDEPPFGLEQVVAIAVPASNPPVDFRKLTQPGLRERGYDDRISPLAMLLNSAMYNTGQRSGMSASEVQQQAMQVIPYRLVPLPKK
jgi:hypothetical protein